ncbi:hypothetical protein SCHPADRAFT_571430 [Schizopora paradoxa]|uniref:F-box domain-containing protein n=1 Tax=Schizopora paradoxa TaxID=27342 RepID=A0A0H2RBT7_9AGAM|nr:hypothetical protein SCHPADRAFT_571430 [Schizopora paradoxa]
MVDKEKKTQQKQNDPLDARRMKRVKLERKKAKEANLKELVPDRFSRLPFELLANVLSFTGACDVLSVARCSRHLCGFLADFPTSSFIWRRARVNTNPPIPDPLPNLTESAYAALLFDPGPCEQCGTLLRTPFISFGLRLRLCQEKNCIQDWLDQKGIGRYKEYDGLPVCFARIYVETCAVRLNSKFTTDILFCRKSEYDPVIRDYAVARARGLSRFDFERLHEFEAEKTEMLFAKSHKIRRWWEDRSYKERSVMHENSKVTRRFATENNWDYWDLLGTPTFRDFYIMKKRSLEEMSKKEIYPLLEVVRNEMEERIGRQRMRTEPDERKGRMRQVEKLYARLRSQGSDSAVPALSVFKGLAVISVVLNNRKKSAEAAKEEMASAPFQALLADNLSVWRENQQRVLLKLIGRPNYAHINEAKPHPLTFCTARFNCTKCKDQALKQFKPVSLSFSDLCKHECAGLSERSSGTWSIANFALDKKAANASKALLGLLALTEENVQVSKVLAHRKLLCGSCDGMVIMSNLRALHEHCQRHENMVFSLFEPGFNMRPSLNVGLRDELLSRKKSAEGTRKEKTLGCRHCLPSRANPDLQHEERDAIPDSTESNLGNYKRFDFDGMRSHLMDRHGVNYIADEDFFRIPLH